MPLPSHRDATAITEDRIPKTEDEEPKTENSRAGAREILPNGVALELVQEPDHPDSGFIHPTQRFSGSQVMHAWESRQPARVPAVDRQKHLTVARHIADSHTAQEVAAAFLGIEQLFPYSGGEPWDLFDLKRKFAKALAKARDHPDLKKARRMEELMAQLEGVG